MSILRNLAVDNAVQLADSIQVKPHQVVSMSLSRSEHVQMTLFAFAKGEEVSEESYFGDTVYIGVEGEVRIQTDYREVKLQQGAATMVPSGVLHAVRGKDEFKMLQITVME